MLLANSECLRWRYILRPFRAIYSAVALGWVCSLHGANVLCLVHTPDISPDKLNFCALEKGGEQSNTFVHLCYTVRPMQTMQVRASISVVIVLITTVDDNDNDNDGVVPNI